MPVPSTMADLSLTAANNSPQGTDPIGNTLDDYLRSIQAIVRSTNALAPASIASASTTDIGSAAAESVEITGTTTITSFGTAPAGIRRELRFAGALTITHSSSIQLPGAKNWLTSAGDVLTFRSLGSGQWIMTGHQALDASRLTGTIPDAVISANFPRKNEANVFSQPQFIAGGTGVGTAATLVLSTNQPGITLSQSDAPANNKNWGLLASAQTLTGYVADDGNSTTTNWLRVTRSGNTVNELNLSATSITLNGVSSSDFARLSQPNTFSANGPAFTISRSSAPNFRINESGAAADNKLWDVTAFSESLHMRALNDAASSATAWLTVDRTGITVDSINLQATSVLANGSQIWTAGNDGSGSGLDADLLDGNHASAFAAASHTHTVSQISDSSSLAKVAGNETISGSWTFSSRPKSASAGGFLSHASSSNTGGSVTVSTSAASGTPENGDIWIQYAE